MDIALIGSAALLGLAGAPHCTAMCGAPCAAIAGSGGRAGALAFHGMRVLGYAMAGAVVASSTAALAQLAQLSPALRPLWTLLHMVALALGLWLLWTGRQPAWLGRVGLGGNRVPTVQGDGPSLRAGTVAVMSAPGAPGASGAPATWQRVQRARRPMRAGLAGGLWVGWPCGLLHSALLVAAMTNTALSGATAMAGFALASSAGLVWGPWLWARLGRAGNARAERWAARLAGLMLCAAAVFALGHGLWHPIAVWCGLA